MLVIDSINSLVQVHSSFLRVSMVVLVVVKKTFRRRLVTKHSEGSLVLIAILNGIEEV